MRSLSVVGALLICSMTARPGFATTPLTTYNFGIADFVESPTQPVIYGTVPSLNSVVVINANTLAITNTIGIGSNPEGITISPDGSTVYVADSGSSFIGRLNTTTLTTLTPLTAPNGSPTELQFGNSNRLWVLGGGEIGQINATTGASTGANLSQANGMYPLLINAGNILVTPDGNTLFYGNYGYSPSNAYKYDVSTTTPQELNALGGGGNGESLALSHNGSVFAYSSAGDSNLALLDSSSLLTLGSVQYGGNAMAFSANDQLLYTAINFTYAVNTYSMSTFLQTGPIINTASEPGELFADNSGQHLFVGEGSETEVFAVPEPASASLLALGCAGLWRRRRTQPTA